MESCNVVLPSNTTESSEGANYWCNSVTQRSVKSLKNVTKGGPVTPVNTFVTVRVLEIPLIESALFFMILFILPNTEFKVNR